MAHDKMPWQVMLQGVGLHQALNITVPIPDVLDALRLAGGVGKRSRQEPAGGKRNQGEPEAAAGAFWLQTLWGDTMQRRCGMHGRQLEGCR